MNQKLRTLFALLLCAVLLLSQVGIAAAALGKLKTPSPSGPFGATYKTLKQVQVTFKWSKVETSKYEVQFVQNGKTTTLGAGNSTKLSWTLKPSSNLKCNQGETIQWRVRAFQNEMGRKSDWSTYAKFYLVKLCK